MVLPIAIADGKTRALEALRASRMVDKGVRSRIDVAVAHGREATWRPRRCFRLAVAQKPRSKRTAQTAERTTRKRA